VSCPLKSSVRGRPQHQTLVSVPPSQFWYIVADERKEGEKFPLLFVLKIFLTAQHHPFLFVQHVVYNTVHTSSSLLSLVFSSILSSIYTSSCFPNSVSLLTSCSFIRWQVYSRNNILHSYRRYQSLVLILLGCCFVRNSVTCIICLCSSDGIDAWVVIWDAIVSCFDVCWFSDICKYIPRRSYLFGNFSELSGKSFYYLWQVACFQQVAIAIISLFFFTFF
jgi:hypothetical protein